MKKMFRYESFYDHVIKKPLRIMRITLFLSLVGILQVFAVDSFSQMKIISLKMENTRIVEVLNEIENQSRFRFVYSPETFDVDDKVSVTIDNKNIKEVLDKIFIESSITYQIFDQQIVLSSSKKLKSFSQKQITISGKVTNQTGSPLPGVTVVIKGTSQGTVTNTDGNYSVIDVPTDAILVFSFLGMKTQKIPVTGQITINVIMAEDAIGIEEVVAIGYGSLKKRDLTSSVTTIRPEEFNKGAYASPVQLLQGKVPGLNITKDGSPSGGATILMRGPSTLSGSSSPYFVIDGVPGASLALVPNDDIVSIDILRDASATAIYGSRAANGVIIVTTKRGKEGQSRISYNSYVAIETISNKIDMLSADEYRNFISSNGLSLDPFNEDNVNTDWMDEVSRIGISHQNNISIGGGNSKTTYIASANYLENVGIIEGSSLKRLTMRANINQKAFNDRLNVGISMSNSVSDTEGFPGQVLLNMINYLPTVKVRNDDGTFKENLELGGTLNPVALIGQNTYESRGKVFLGSINAQLNIMKGLDYKLIGSYQNSQSNSGVYNSKNSAIAQGLNGQASRSSYEYEKKIFETFLTYEKDLGKHGLKLLAGYSWQEDVNTNGFAASNVNFVSDETSYYNLGLGSAPTGYTPNYGSAGLTTLRMISVYSRLNYDYNGKYLLQATVRRDGSSAFGENERWGMFPSASVAWRITEEGFMQDQNLFDNLKLRVGYGVSGNSLGFNPLASIMRYGNSGRYYYNGQYPNSIAPTQNDNPDLKWERTGMLNVGLDFSTLKGRLSGTVEYYNKVTKDMIWWYPVSTTKYFVGSLLANVGEMENKGFEVSVSAIPVKTSNFTWNTSFNVSFNTNEVKSLSNDEFTTDFIKTAGVGDHGQSGNTVQIIEEGYPIGQFYIWQYAGKREDGTSQFYTKDGDLTINPSSDDHFYLGNVQPKAIFGWSNSFTYGNFDLNLLFRGVTGNKILNVTAANLNYPAEATHYNMPKMTLNESINDNRSHYASDRYIEKGDYVRLDNLTLGYNFDLSTNAIKKLRLYASVNNVFVITGYKGLDPEVSMGGITPGLDNNNYYPKTRSFIFGVNVDF